MTTLNDWLGPVTQDVFTSSWFEAVINVLRFGTLLLLIGAYSWKIHVMNANTQKWDRLGYALRWENAVYLLLWLWVFVRPFHPILGHPLITLALMVALVWITLRVIHELPRPMPSGRDDGRMRVSMHDRDGTRTTTTDTITVTHDEEELS